MTECTVTTQRPIHVIQSRITGIPKNTPPPQKKDDKQHGSQTFQRNNNITQNQLQLKAVLHCISALCKYKYCVQHVGVQKNKNKTSALLTLQTYACVHKGTMKKNNPNTFLLLKIITNLMPLFTCFISVCTNAMWVERAEVQFSADLQLHWRGFRVQQIQNIHFPWFIRKRM